MLDNNKKELDFKILNLPSRSSFQKVKNNCNKNEP
jgi:hypothetical protein